MKGDTWHDKEEEFLAGVERQCNILNDHYSKEYTYYHTLSSKFNIPILIVSSVNALTAVALNEFLAQKFVSILNAVLSAGTGVLGSIQLFMKINEKMTSAFRSSINFKRLALKISKELSIGRDQRITEGQPFLSECFAEFNTTLEQSNPMERKLANHLEFSKINIPIAVTPRERLMTVANRLMNLGSKNPSGGSSPDSNQQMERFNDL
jgi:hypothetical protein